MEMKVGNMSEVGVVVVLTECKQNTQHQRFKCRYSENVIHRELENVKC